MNHKPLKIQSRAELIRYIREDWQERTKEGRRTESFIYGYFKEIKEETALWLAEDKKRLTEAGNKDPYTLLRALTIGYETGLLSKEEYQSAYCNLRWKKEQARHRRMLSAGIEEIRKSADAYEKTLLSGIVTDFFRNEGYYQTPVATDTDRELIEHTPEQGLTREGKRRTYRERDDIQLLLAWIDYEDGEPASARDNQADIVSSDMPDALSNGGCMPDDAGFIRKCEELYHRLDHFHRDRIFIPLYINRSMGTGLYIIGKDFFDEFSLPDGGVRSCYICILYFDDVPYIEDDLSEICAACFSDLREGFRAYMEDLKAGYYLDVYLKVNAGISLPLGTDKDFLMFFPPKDKRFDPSPEEKQLMKDYAEEENAALEKMMQNNRR